MSFLKPIQQQQVNDEPWVILIFQLRFINCNKHTILVSDADSGEERACEG